MSAPGVFTITVTAADLNKRLDILLASTLTDCSRNRAAVLIRNGNVRVSGLIRKPGYTVHVGDVIQGEIPPPEPAILEPEQLDFQVLFEDKAMIVVDKPAGMVVHPSPGHPSGTLVHGLLHHCPEMEGIGGQMRPGIVHRLDKDTSGVIVVAKNQTAHNHLSAQFKSRKINKHYLALVFGIFDAPQGKIDFPIGRHPSDRKKMSIFTRRPRSAETHWQVRETLNGITLLDLKILTGRTHQIRVHCAAVHHPLVGDPAYGSRKRRLIPSKPIQDLLASVSRQMLHALRIELDHPLTGEPMGFEAPVPSDMASLIQGLRQVDRDSS